MRTLDYLAIAEDEKRQPHVLQEVVERVVAEELSEHEREIFFLRFGEQLTFREIAERLGYDSHQTFQYHVNKIIEKVKVAVGRYYESDAASGD